MNRILKAALVAALTLLAYAPASAALNPTYTTFGTIFGPPNVGRIVQGVITLGAADTYTTGGFTINPASLGYSIGITNITFGNAIQPFDPVATYSGGVATVKLYNQGGVSGASNVAATATTATVTGLSGLTINMPILCQLDDAATGGGGSGTWIVTVAVASCKYASATSFTITTTAGAPTNNGNFTYLIPSLQAEVTSGIAVPSLVMAFVAVGQ